MLESNLIEAGLAKIKRTTFARFAEELLLLTIISRIIFSLYVNPFSIQKLFKQL